MKVYPIIELQGGKCVSLLRGLMDSPHVWHVDPIERAREYAAAGATMVHVTDLDAVAHRDIDNAEIIEEMIRKAGIPITVAGGLGSDEAIRKWYDLGAARMVLGSAAVRYPEWVQGLSRTYPDQIVLALDIWEGKIAIDGWTTTAMIEPSEFLKAFDGWPLAAVVITDISRDLEMPDSSFALVSRLAESTRSPVYASGLVKSLDDISSLKYIPNIAAVMLGKALMTRDIDLAEAIELAQPVPEKIAPFQ